MNRSPADDRAQRREEALAKIQAARAKIAIDDATWNELRDGLALFLMGEPAAARAILLHGPPGTGKTAIAQAIAATAQIHFVALSIAELKMNTIGSSGGKVRDTWNAAAAKPRSIIFIDECDAIFAKRGGVDADVMTNEIVAAILPRIDGMERKPNVLLIGATNNLDSIDPAIRSRFDAQIRIGMPNAAARLAILRACALTYNCPMAMTAAEADATDGMSGRDLDSLVRMVTQRAHSGTQPEQAFANIVAAKRAAAGNVARKDMTWDDVILPSHTMTTLQRYALMLSRRAELAQAGLNAIPRGVLLTGPPGTGKTQVARVMASVAKVGFIAVGLPDLKGAWVGHTGKLVRAIFERARSISPCIVFIDEIDTIAPARGGGGDQFTADLIGQLLQEIDGVTTTEGGIMLMAATNHADAIDPAVRSRFTETVDIALPRRAERERILIYLLKDRRVVGPPEDLAHEIAQHTSGKSGRDLRNLVDQAVQKAAARFISLGGGPVGLLPCDFEATIPPEPEPPSQRM